MVQFLCVGNSHSHLEEAALSRLSQWDLGRKRRHDQLGELYVGWLEVLVALLDERFSFCRPCIPSFHRGCQRDSLTRLHPVPMSETVEI